jgi:FkbH-like protein
MTDLQPIAMDHASLLRESKRLDPAATRSKVRIALLSDAATQQFVPLLRTLFHRHGVHADLYEGPFDGIQLEALNPNSGLYRFQPDFIVMLNSIQALRAAFSQRNGDASAFIEERTRGIVEVWDTIQQHTTATLVQSTFAMPYERYFGNFDQKVPSSFYSVAAALNACIGQQVRSRAGVLINDVESIASWVGRREWFDDRFWDIAKSFCALPHMPLVAKNIVDIVMASRGRVAKCVVLDLDNTLWGGVIGDDGVDGIRLSAHGDGEAFYRLQAYLKELRNRGILLAVCSKNEMAAAVLPFDKHPDMLLQRSDITVFIANWIDKAENIRKIHDVLNIGFDSMVFLDDNPFERNWVRGLLPDVIVPELPEDPADYVRAISELNLFETTSFSGEDLKRAELYRVEADRREAQAAYASAEDFLQSLDMRIVVSRFDPFHLPRIAQLIQRSNQFNLTTHRYTEAECDALMNNPNVLPLYAKLSDRLGDHGLIGLIVMEPRGDELVIVDWLMSCRVLARGVEQYLMNLVVAEARQRNLTNVRGQYIRTAKNQMVEGFFAQFGFVQTGGDANRADWLLDCSTYQARETFISPAGELAATVHP